MSPDSARAGDPSGDPFVGTAEAASPETLSAPDTRPQSEPTEGPGDLSTNHLRGLLEALVFASDKPVSSGELAKMTSAPLRNVKALMNELKDHYGRRGIVLQEVAGGWAFRTSVEYAPFVRELTGERPVKLTRAQVETLAITAYRQPITRPEIDEIRGVDSGATLKVLLERELLRILGKKDEPGRPLLYGTTAHFLEFFGLKSLRDLPTLREFTELSEDSQRTLESLPRPESFDTDATQLQASDSPGKSLRAADAAPEGAGALDREGAEPAGPTGGNDEARDTLVPSAPPTGDDIEDPPDSDGPATESG